MNLAQRSSLCLLTTSQLESVVRDSRAKAREAKAEEGANSIGHRARLEYLRGCLEELATRSNSTELVTLVKAGRVLRWVDGAGTALVPCTIVKRDGAWTTVTLQDGTTVRTCTEYVLAGAA